MTDEKNIIDISQKEVNEDYAKAGDKEAIRKIINSIIHDTSREKMPSPEDLLRIKNLAAKYPDDGEFQRLLDKAEEAFEKAKEAEEEKRQKEYRLNSSSIDKKIKDFEEEFKRDPLGTLLNYLEDEEGKENTKNLDAFLNNELIINDNFSFNKFIKVANQVGSALDRFKRETFINSEELYDKINQLNKKTKEFPDLATQEEKDTNAKTQIKLSKVIDRTIFDKVVNKHEEIYQKKAHEFNHSQANRVIEETKEVRSILRECANEEHELVALSARNPEVINKLILTNDKKIVDKEALRSQIEAAAKAHEASIEENKLKKQEAETIKKNSEIKKESKIQESLLIKDDALKQVLTQDKSEINKDEFELVKEIEELNSKFIKKHTDKENIGTPEEQDVKEITNVEYTVEIEKPKNRFPPEKIMNESNNLIQDVVFSSNNAISSIIEKDNKKHSTQEDKKEVLPPEIEKVKEETLKNENQDISTKLQKQNHDIEVKQIEKFKKEQQNSHNISKAEERRAARLATLKNKLVVDSETKISQSSLPTKININHNKDGHSL